MINNDNRPDGGLKYSPVWSITVDYLGNNIEISWCEISSSKIELSNFVDHSMLVKENGKRTNAYDDWAYKVAQSIRSSEVRKNLEIKNSSELSAEALADVIEFIFERVSDGDYMGQSRGNIIYIQELAQVLDIDFSTVMRIVDTVLFPQERIGLNGMILTPWKSLEESRVSLEKQSGHKDLRRSDFGDWFCGHCKKDGDDQEKPSETPCS